MHEHAAWEVCPSHLVTLDPLCAFFLAVLGRVHILYAFPLPHLARMPA